MGQIIITTIVVSVLCALFALLLSFADKYIADYGLLIVSFTSP